jgi:prepilin-type N-terminal cleavage/methylation domain-containing protein
MKRLKQASHGFSLIELLIVIAVLGILLGIAAVTLNGLNQPLENASNQLQSVLKGSRIKAISTTSAHRVRPLDSKNIVVEWSKNCAETAWTPDSTLAANLPDEVELSSTTWSVCFNSRGVANAVTSVSVQNDAGRTKTVKVFLGGAVQETP